MIQAMLKTTNVTTSENSLTTEFNFRRKDPDQAARNVHYSFI